MDVAHTHVLKSVTAQDVSHKDMFNKFYLYHLEYDQVDCGAV
jgi:hypothetical protein